MFRAPASRVRLAILLIASAALLAVLPALAAAAQPSVVGANGASAWTYRDLQDAGAKYEGGYAVFSDTEFAGDYDDPHGGYDTATNKCKVCHAVHRAEGAYYLLRADSQDDACDYCHIGSAHSSKVVYDLSSAGKDTPNGHTIGASTAIPDSTVAQWTEEVTLTAADENGDPVSETIRVRAYDAAKNDMYRFARHHGHSQATGGARRNYVPVGPLALRCMNCHQVHDATAQTWRSISMASMTDAGAYVGADVSSYKLLKQFPSGTFVGGPDAYGQIPLANISVVPETTLTAGANFDAVRAMGEDPGDTAFQGGTYNKPMWVAGGFDREGSAARGERSNPAAVNNAALSVWCADCHNLNIGGSTRLANPELGFKAHAERTHPAPYTGAFSGPGQCYSCHRNDLPRVNTGDPCSQCHYGTGNYRENRYDAASPEYVASDFPHSGEDGDFKMLGSYSVDVAGMDPTTIVETVAVGPDNLDAVCLRCHWVEERYHDSGAPTSASGHAVPALYAACSACHPGEVDAIHASAPAGCDSCHSGSTLTSDCATCHSDIANPDGSVIDHGYPAELHAAEEPCTSSCHAADLSAAHTTIGCYGCHPSPAQDVAPWDKQCDACHPAIEHDSASGLHQGDEAAVIASRSTGYGCSSTDPTAAMFGGPPCHDIADVGALHKNVHDGSGGCGSCHDESVTPTTDCRACHTQAETQLMHHNNVMWLNVRSDAPEDAYYYEGTPPNGWAGPGDWDCLGCHGWDLP